MSLRFSRFVCAAVAALLGGSVHVYAQAASTATERLQLSAFGGITGVYTGLARGRNLSVTAGADLEMRRFYHLNPALEVRGTLPFDNGRVAGERNLLGGIRLSGSFGRLHPYADVLFGRGELRYDPPALSYDRTFLYTQTTSNVLSPGIGLEFRISPSFSVRGDAQYQRYATPVTASGHTNSKPITAAVTYHFNFNRHAIGRGR